MIGPGQVVSLGAPPGAVAWDSWCGGIPVVKQMLYDLGYYHGVPSGPNNWRAEDNAAMNAFALDEALPYRSDVVMPYHCERLIARWEGKFAQTLKSQMVRVAREDPAAVNSARLMCMAKPGYTWDPVSNVCVAPARTLVGTLPPEMEVAQACVDAGGVWHSDTKRCFYPDEAGTEPAGWWDKQSIGVKAAVIGGGVVATGGLLFALTR